MFPVLTALALVVQLPTGSGDAAIDAAKQAVVGEIEPGMPDLTLEAWLESLSREDSDILWNVNDCGEQTGDAARNQDRQFPVCVEGQATLDGGQTLTVSLVVGTFGGGIGDGIPSLWTVSAPVAGANLPNGSG